VDRTQFGFRKGKGTIEAIYVLTEAIEENIEKERGKVFACFVDLKAAFDKVKRKKIWDRLRKKGVEEKLVRRIEEIYKETKVKICIGNEIIDEFETEEGVRQGCPMS
jgi:predicted GNAT family acetyltransferase